MNAAFFLSKLLMTKVSEHGPDVYLEFIRQKVELEYVATALILVLILIHCVLPAKNIHTFSPRLLLLLKSRVTLCPWIILLSCPRGPSNQKKLWGCVGFVSARQKLSATSNIPNSFRKRLSYPLMLMTASWNSFAFLLFLLWMETKFST